MVDDETPGVMVLYQGRPLAMVSEIGTKRFFFNPFLGTSLS